jgi:GNAT superfamily N-acetyltransferase
MSNPSKSTAFNIRPAAPGDEQAILGLIRELAEYEHALDEVEATEGDLQRDLFGENPKVHADVVELEGAVVGTAIWFLNYSTWQGKHGLYLEDLYIQPQHRGLGMGKAMLQYLAAKCLTLGYGRVQWWVVDWNEPSIEFYKAHGAVAMDEWTVYRVSGAELEKLADS